MRLPPSLVPAPSVLSLRRGLVGSSLLGVDGWTTPQSVDGDRNYSVLETGAYHACGISEGRVWCWGEGKSGKLGQGTTANSAVPVPLFDSRRAYTALALGREHTCALETPVGDVPGGAAWCWGGTWWGYVSGWLPSGTACCCPTRSLSLPRLPLLLLLPPSPHPLAWSPCSSAGALDGRPPGCGLHQRLPHPPAGRG